jgi:hypothetical protein
MGYLNFHGHTFLFEIPWKYLKIDTINFFAF